MVASIRLVCGHDWEIFSSSLMDTVGSAVPRQVGLGSMRKVVEQARGSIPLWSQVRFLPRVPTLASLNAGL